jgi:hypothetical protein
VVAGAHARRLTACPAPAHNRLDAGAGLTQRAHWVVAACVVEATGYALTDTFVLRPSSSLLRRIPDAVSETCKRSSATFRIRHGLVYVRKPNPHAANGGGGLRAPSEISDDHRSVARRESRNL